MGTDQVFMRTKKHPETEPKPNVPPSGGVSVQCSGRLRGTGDRLGSRFCLDIVVQVQDFPCFARHRDGSPMRTRGEPGTGDRFSLKG